MYTCYASKYAPYIYAFVNKNNTNFFDFCPLFVQNQREWMTKSRYISISHIFIPSASFIVGAYAFSVFLSMNIGKLIGIFSFLVIGCIKHSAWLHQSLWLQISSDVRKSKKIGFVVRVQQQFSLVFVPFLVWRLFYYFMSLLFSFVSSKHYPKCRQS